MKNHPQVKVPHEDQAAKKSLNVQSSTIVDRALSVF